RNRGNNTLDRGQKAHVEHTVGLVQYERGQPTKIDHSLLHKIHQPAGRGDEYIDTALEGRSLLAVTGPADYGCAVDAFRGELAAFGIDLISQFTRRGKHEYRGALAALTSIQLL